MLRRKQPVLPGVVQLDDDVVVAAGPAVIVAAARRLWCATRRPLALNERHDDQEDQDNTKGQCHGENVDHR